MDLSLVSSAICAFAISVTATPIIINYSKRKGLLAAVNHRSSHDESVPNTGGIILCFAVLIPLMVFSEYPSQEDFTAMLSAFSVLLITGIIDDFNPLPVAFKFLGQFIPAIVIVTSIDANELALPFLHNYFSLPGFFVYLVWILFIVMAINAFNLIDGIDGLAIGMGIIGGVFYLISFLSLGMHSLAVFSIALTSGLAGLLFYNFSKRRKIFLGDTGSLFIGGLMVFFGLKYINFSDSSTINSSFYLVIGSIFIPLADMFRVALERILKGISPFHADRTHIHHMVLDLCRGNHLKSTTLLLILQAIIIILFFYTSKINEAPFLLFSILAVSGYFGMIWIIKIRVRHQPKTSGD